MIFFFTVISLKQARAHLRTITLLNRQRAHYAPLFLCYHPEAMLLASKVISIPALVVSSGLSLMKNFSCLSLL